MRKIITWDDILLFLGILVVFYFVLLIFHLFYPENLLITALLIIDFCLYVGSPLPLIALYYSQYDETGMIRETKKNKTETKK